MGERAAPPFVLPWLPEGRVVPVAGRGEFFVRVHQHPDRDRPTLALFHGWTASADVQFFTAYRSLADRYSFVAIDHRGHGRGLRTMARFRLEDAADDMAAVLAELDVGRVTTVGYSMGGPISMLFTRHHRERVQAMVVQATALEWHASLRERIIWYGLPLFGATLRSWAYPRYLRRAVARLVPVGHELEPYLPWILGEMQRGSSQTIVEAGRCLSRYDGTPWAGDLGVPAGALVTTRDQLVAPRKQRQLAEALSAVVHELDGDHFSALARPGGYAAATVGMIAEVHARAGVRE